MTLRARWPTAVLVLALATAAACTGGGDGAAAGDERDPAGDRRPPVGAEAEADRPAGLTATLVQYREDEAQDIVEIQIHNRRAEAVRVSELALRWPGLEPRPPVPADTRIAPGIRLDVPVPHGEARCSDPPRLDEPRPASPGRAVGRGRVSGGAVPLRLTVDDPRDILGRLHRLGCRRQAVEWAATIGFGETWRVVADGDRRVLRGAVTVRRNHAWPAVAVTDVDGSVLLAIRPAAGAGLPLVLRPSRQAVELPVVVAAAGRCEPHALADSKKTFVFHLAVQVGRREPVAYEVIAEGATRAHMQAVIDHTCGSGR